MKKQTVISSKDLNLRKRAIELLQTRPAKPSLKYSEADVLKLIHELEVHQVELELQNEELVKAKEKEAELATEKYIELYDFAPSGYLTLSREGKIIDLNLAGAKMLNKERSRLKNSSFGFFVTNDTKPIFNLFLDQVFSGKNKESCEIILSPSDNLPMNVHLTGIVNGDGDFCLLNMFDITGRIETEKQLITAKEKAEESDRLKSAFLANVSHEIRTPMNGILGFAELLKDQELTDAKKQRYISIIEQSGARMLSIVNDILDISKIESGQMEIFRSNTNINKQIDSVYAFFNPEVEQKGLELLCKKGLPDKKSIIETDQEKIEAILINLIKNAIKFTKTGYIEYGYRLKSRKDKAYLVSTEDELEFFVKDTGIGIRPEQLKLIFERFRQGSDLLSRNYEGTGLGLSISKGYVEMLGGKIRAESKPGNGSVFYFTIPYTLVPEEKTGSENAVFFDEGVIPEKKLNLLIVEDDEFSEKLLTIAVEKLCKKLIQVRTGVEAVHACRNNPDLDLILMDIKLPEMDGYEASRQIRKFNNDVIIIAQTAFGLVGEREKAIASGCTDYISKPLNIAMLSSLILKYFSKHAIM